MTIRAFFRSTLLLGALTASCLAAGPAQAAYPEQPITMVVNFSAGGPLDQLARVLGKEAHKELGQIVVVEAKPGATGTIGAEYVSRAKPDGYTLLLSVDTVATVTPFAYKGSTFDANKSLEPVALAGALNQVLVVRKDLGVKNLKDFLDLTKKRDIAYASAGIGSPGHLTMEAFRLGSHSKLTHVPYKGNAPATNDLLGGQVDAAFVVIGGVLPHIKAGKLVPLAVSSKEPDPFLPDTPTVASSGIPGLENFNYQFYNVIMAPKGTPENIKKIWSDFIAKAFTIPEVREKFEALGQLTIAGTPEQARAYLATEAAARRKVIEKAGIAVN